MKKQPKQEKRSKEKAQETDVETHTLFKTQYLKPQCMSKGPAK